MTSFHHGRVVYVYHLRMDLHAIIRDAYAVVLLGYVRMRLCVAQLAMAIVRMEAVSKIAMSARHLRFHMVSEVP